MNITMPRGDVRPISFTITGADDVTFDEIYFTVKDRFDRKEFLFQKRLSTGEISQNEDGSYQFFILAEDTDNLSVKKYVFDIELVAGSDIKQTFIGELILTNEVTFAVNEG